MEEGKVVNRKIDPQRAQAALNEIGEIQESSVQSPFGPFAIFSCLLFGIGMGLIAYPSYWGFLLVALAMMLVLWKFYWTTSSRVRPALRQDPKLGEEFPPRFSIQWWATMMPLFVIAVHWLPGVEGVYGALFVGVVNAIAFGFLWWAWGRRV